MSANVKFKFHLKSGKVFECIEELNEAQFKKTVETCREAFREGVDGMLMFPDCCIRLAECAVVEWEEL